MKLAVFSAKAYDRSFMRAANARRDHQISFFDARLDETTVDLCQGFDAVCVFVNDRLPSAVVEQLAAVGVQAILLRCAGYDNLDLAAAGRCGLLVGRVPAYSPHAVAEYALGLLLAVCRNIPRAWARVREDNFALDGLIGRNIHGRTAGVVGTGAIGGLVARALRLGFDCEVLACDPVPDPGLQNLGIDYVPREELLRRAEIVSLHCPLTPDTRHLIDAGVIARARQGIVLINTGRGGLVDAAALIEGLKSGQVGGAGLDVYEQEAPLFFQDLSGQVVQDDLFQRLLTFPNVVVTGHQAFLSEEALAAISETTLSNLTSLQHGEPMPGALALDEHRGPPRP